MFGISFSEITLIAAIALIVVGPQKLPGMLRTLGVWLGKLRRLTSDMRAQTGIDDILREEGIDGVTELRSLLRGETFMAARRAKGTSRAPALDPYADMIDPDPAVEYPVEGPDTSGAIPDDLCAPSLAEANRTPAATEADGSGPSPQVDPAPQIQPELPEAPSGPVQPAASPVQPDQLQPDQLQPGQPPVPGGPPQASGTPPQASGTPSQASGTGPEKSRSQTPRSRPTTQPETPMARANTSPPPAPSRPSAGPPPPPVRSSLPPRVARPGSTTPSTAPPGTRPSTLPPPQVPPPRVPPPRLPRPSTPPPRVAPPRSNPPTLEGSGPDAPAPKPSEEDANG